MPPSSRLAIDTAREIRTRGTAAVAKANALRARSEILLDRSHTIHRMLSRQLQRYATIVPPIAPPALRCPACDAALQYVNSQIGGVSAKSPEQWDYYTCPNGCSGFQYRHRTRTLRRIG